MHFRNLFLSFILINCLIATLSTFGGTHTQAKAEQPPTIQSPAIIPPFSVHGNVDKEWLSDVQEDYWTAVQLERSLKVTRQMRADVWAAFLNRIQTAEQIESVKEAWTRGRDRLDYWNNRVAMYRPSGELVVPADSCRSLTGEFHSKSCGRDIKFHAFIPGVKGKQVRFPVLYLLHGAWDDYTAWPSHSKDDLIRLSKKYGLIIICPDGGPFGWYADSPLQADSQIETSIIRELIPYVESVFPAEGRRAVAGLSMGGHGAFTLTLRNPGMFVSMSSMSGILDITQHPNQWHIKDVFGNYESNADLWKRHSAYCLIKTTHEKKRDSKVKPQSFSEISRTKKDAVQPLITENVDALSELGIMFTVSTSDKFALPDNRKLEEYLKGTSLPYIYRESPGDHDWAYWTQQLPVHAAFHARVLNGDMND